MTANECLPTPRTAPSPERGASRRTHLPLILAVLLAAAPLACGGGQTDDAAATKGKGKPGKGRRGRGRGRSGAGAHGQAQGHAAQALKIGVTQLSPRDIQRHYSTAATLLPMRRAEIRPLQSGIITELAVEEGDRVEANQVLARLDEREIKLQAARDDLTARNAQKELDRLEHAAKRNLVPREELEKQRFMVASAKASARLTRHQVSQRKIRAPFAGTITERLADMGNLASSSEAIYQLADLSTLKIEVHVPELQAASIEIGDAVELGLIDKRTFSGKVLRRAPMVDALTGTIKFTLETGAYPAQAMPGAFVRASILIEERKAVASLPNKAIFEVNGESAVFIVADGRARRTTIKTGLEGAEYTEILSGLGDKDLVIQDGANLTVGTRVQPILKGAADQDAKAPKAAHN